MMTVISGAIGLFAILLGALFNAHLNRCHDRWRSRREEMAIRQSLAAELKALSKVALDRLGFLFAAADGRVAATYPLSARLETPGAVVFNSNAGKIGRLPPAMAAEVIAVYARWDVILNLIRVGARGDNAPETAKQRMAELASFQDHVGETVRLLEGRPGDVS